ncbi:MAG: hypothetical protein HN891_00135 [Planctomycetes bacterium]|nr:hypothetical protein [Planctomycetota bacterium]MBT6453487.1 hypothetical protein [Planctomycetota bacterium]MBT6541198.1 hypothetical protein [Planctomycetota bacterium]MBT6785720.1 hypothetical protein [Planctomycetota bacterium]MBT6969098.1 hypothetical protein [Planctomycetota bacterium]
MESLDRLREVQRISSKISLYKSEIAKREKKLEIALADYQQLRNQMAPIEARLVQGQSIVRKFELDSKEADAKIEKNRKQLDQATQATEFTGLKEQLARFDEEKAAIDESLILVMEKIEELRSQESELNKQIAEAEEQLEEIRAEVTENTKDYRNEVESLQKPLESAREAADDELLETFDRLFPSLGATVVVSLDGNACGGCHLSVSSQVGEKVQQGVSVVNCPSCSRFLG